MANDLNNSQAGIEGSCPRCMAELIARPGGWRGLVDMTTYDPECPDMPVYHCVHCGHYEDAVIRANRLAQHQQVAQEVA